ncbi:MAG: hypothetical protein M1813_000953 [Trichoglossum hirsutum]|nr:MAG: hypothetical protein M1813_000953 [Trichoglossum hirsutum]
MRCKNQGSDYDDENIQWTCTASLPPEFKLGSTDVICEGYKSREDPYILKGSCGVEYRLLLTDKGEEKYGRGGNLWRNFNGRDVDWAGRFFWLCVVGAVGWMIYSAFFTSRRRGWRPAGGNIPWGWGWGGGGGGGGNDPPPPYDWQPPRKPWTSTPRAGQEGWRPGFWSGALGGAAAGYLASNRNRNQPPRTQGWAPYNNGGEGSSRTGSGRSSSGSGSSARHESTGFGSTSRR